MERTLVRNALRSGLLVGFALISPALNAQSAAGDRTLQAIESRIATDGRARVIVRLQTPESATGRQSADSEQARRLDINARQQRIRDQLRGTNHNVRREFRSLPYVVVEVDAAGLARLQQATGDVAQISEDPLLAPTLAFSIPQIEADVAHDEGYNGSGSVIAIVDTGVDNSHPFLAGKVVDEACFADREQPSDPGSCPNGSNQQFGVGAAVPCSYAASSCQHGTHVAGIAAGSGTNPGVAPSANLFALQVFHRSAACSIAESIPCARAFVSDVTAALEYVYERRALHNLASVNMSLGGGPASSPCDSLLPATAAVIGNLKAAGIATVIASGNSFDTARISFPACIDAAISVGAVDDDDNVASFSNVAEALDLFAPGVSIVSSVPGGGFASFSGTSMAAPHVAGAWAAMRQANPLASVDDVLTSLANTGKPIFDGRTGGTVTKPRMRLGAALGIESPLPVLLAVSPSTVRSGPGVTVSALGTGFVRASVVRVNGAPRPTTYVSDTQLRVQVTSADLQTGADSLAITVATPPPGGGISASVPLIVIHPVLSVNTTTASTGSPVTVTLTNGSGVANDWLAVARVGTSNTSYLNWTYVGAGNTTFSWTANMPNSAGTYEFRLFSADGYTRTATSPAITVTEAAPPPPPPPPPTPDPPTLAVSSTAANTGAAITVTLANGSGVANDWIGLARVGDPVTTYLAWTLVGAGNTAFAWTANMPNTAGEYEFRLFSAGGYGLAATSPTITVTQAAPPPPPPPPPTPNQPTLAVSSTAANTGAPITVTLANGTGVASDWIGLARVGDPVTSYLTWTYVGSGSSFVWTTNMPGTPGNYEFRLFSAGTYTRLATSPAISVTAAPPSNPPVLTLDTTVASPGEAVTVTLTNGSGAWNDWIALARVEDLNTSYLNWTNVGAGNTTFVWTASMPLTPGRYEFRLFSAGSYARIATSLPIEVGP